MIRTYIDVDGVLNPFPWMGRTGDFNDFENHNIMFVAEKGWQDGRTLTVRLSRKMVQELKNLDVEIVFNTTWCDYPAALQELASIVGLDGTRQLYYDDPSGALWRHYRHQKALKLVEDVKEHGEPFIWVDDEAIDMDGASHVKVNTDVPRLFIVPNSRTGLTMENISTMREFISQHSREA